MRKLSFSFLVFVLGFVGTSIVFITIGVQKSLWLRPMGIIGLCVLLVLRFFCRGVREK